MNRLETISVYAGAKHAEDLRALCSGDLFFLLVYAMRRKDMDNDWIFARCREVQGNPDGYLDLWAREHYKSTIITVGLTILNILNNPDITVGIFSHSRPIAKAFLRQIKREFETNRVLQEYLPSRARRNPDMERRRRDCCATRGEPQGKHRGSVGAGGRPADGQAF